MARIVPIAISLLLLAGCDRSPFPGYKKIADDVHLRLYMLGDGDRLPRDGDSVLFRLRISHIDSPSGSYFSGQQWYAVKDLRKSAFDHLLVRMHQGDSMSLIANVAHLPWRAITGRADTISLDSHHPLRTEASIIAVRSAEMIAAAKTGARVSDPIENEQRLIASFLDRLGTNWRQWGTSFIHYTIEGKVTDTLQVRKGDLVTIKYTGRRLEDGKVFDSSDRNGSAYTFRFGDEGQVIKGVEIAISLLREGQKGEFFLPSEFAFGERGVEGSIEPYTPVIYQVKLLKVERGRRS